MHELPLMIFTLFLQGSVGVTLWLGLVRQRSTSMGISRKRPAMAMLTGAFIVACAGLMASALHMGYPLNAFHALRHFSRSWLSREIIFASLYLAALGASLIFAWSGKSVWKPLALLAALLGVIDVYCMAQIYIHSSVVTWQHVNTLLLFVCSTGILGSVAISLAELKGTLHFVHRIAPYAAALVVLLVVARFAMQPFWLADITAADAQIMTFPHSPLQMLHQLRGVQVFSSCLSIAGMLCFAFGGMKKSAAALLSGSVLLIVAEFVQRFIFFSIG